MMRGMVMVVVVVMGMVMGKEVLRVDEQGKFKISQFTDLHFGEAENLDWGPRQDRGSLMVMGLMMDYEQPDLVVFTGDQMTGNNIRDNATDIWDQIMTPLVDRHQKYLAVMGNHDDLYWEEGMSMGWHMQQGVHPKKSTVGRDRLYAHDMTIDGSYTQVMFRSKQCSGGNDYYQLVYDEKGEKVVMVLWLLDSGGGTIQENICQDSIEWLKTTAQALTQVHGQVPQMAFMHIPMWQYVGLYDNTCWGMNENGGVTPTQDDTGLYQAFKEMGVHWVVSGHDHGNDWCCRDQNAQMLCFGRHTGYGGYGRWDRGSRIYELDTTTNTIRSWVRMQDGSIIHATQ